MVGLYFYHCCYFIYCLGTYLVIGEIMSKSDDGGPAFPFTPNQQMQLDDGTWDQDVEFGDSGMSLRDYFAGQTLQGIISSPALITNNHLECLYIFSRISYEQADAMIKERNKTCQPS